MQHGHGLRARRKITKGEEFLDPTVRWHSKIPACGGGFESERIVEMRGGCFSLCDDDKSHAAGQERTGGRRSVFFCSNEAPGHGLAVARAEATCAIKRCALLRNA